MINKSILLNVDSYKCSQWKQYPPNTTNIFSYIEARGGKYEKILFFGLQMFLKEYLSKPITLEDIAEAEEFTAAHGVPFNKEGWLKLLDKHGGYLPLRIRAVEEGTVVPVSNVLVTVENTDPEFYWLTSYLETAILRAVWYPSTVATNSWYSKQIIKQYLEETGDVNLLPFKLVDFGARGVSSFESAGIGGVSHMVNFMASDTITGALFARKYYNEPMAAYSIPASEHSTITSWGKINESKAYKNMLDQFAKPGALVACVSDSYDIMNACDIWGTELKQQIIDSGATLIVRPDSGHPETVVLDVVHRLDKHFGHTVNDKGYKVLNNVRVIQGDGIDLNSIRGILMNLKFAGYSADNISMGQGGKLLQAVDRDTCSWAMKCSSAIIDGNQVDVFKDPVTDSGKRSKKGRIDLIKFEGKFLTAREEDTFNLQTESLLETVWENGKLVKDLDFSTIRANSNK